MKRNAHYPVTHTQIQTFGASSGSQQISINIVLFRPITERILIVLVKKPEFVASASTNPYHFKHYYMTNLMLCVNGVKLPSEPLTMDSSSPFGATRA